MSKPVVARAIAIIYDAAIAAGLEKPVFKTDIRTLDVIGKLLKAETGVNPLDYGDHSIVDFGGVTFHG